MYSILNQQILCVQWLKIWFFGSIAEEIAEKINSGDIDHVISLNLSPAIIEQAQHLAELITNNELQLPQLCDKTATKGVKRTRVEVPLRNQNHGSKEIQFDDEVIELPSCSSSKKLKGDQMPQVKELETVVIGISVKDDKPPSKVIVTPLVTWFLNCWNYDDCKLVFCRSVLLIRLSYLHRSISFWAVLLLWKTLNHRLSAWNFLISLTHL